MHKGKVYTPKKWTYICRLYGNCCIGVELNCWSSYFTGWISMETIGKLSNAQRLCLAKKCNICPRLQIASRYLRRIISFIFIYLLIYLTYILRWNTCFNFLWLLVCIFIEINWLWANSNCFLLVSYLFTSHFIIHVIKTRTSKQKGLLALF